MAYGWTRVKMNGLTPCRFIHTFMYKLSWAPVARGPAEVVPLSFPVLGQTRIDPLCSKREQNWIDPLCSKRGHCLCLISLHWRQGEAHCRLFVKEYIFFIGFFFFFCVCAKLSECKDLSPNLVSHNFSKAFYFLLKFILPHFLHLFTVLWVQHRSDSHEGRKGRI